MPGYRDHVGDFKAKGVNEIWCVSVNDAFVMGAWAKEQQTDGKVRMFGDGSAVWTKALGLEMDATAFGMGTRMMRFSMLLENGAGAVAVMQAVKAALDPHDIMNPGKTLPVQAFSL